MNEITLLKQSEAVSMQTEIISVEREVNTVLTSSKMVAPVFHAHYVNMETGENGIANLITKILTEKGATASKSMTRETIIDNSLFTDDIFEAVQSHFTSESIRYPRKTIENYLSVFMFRQNIVGKIKLSNVEDYFRPCCKPRNKWYLIK